MIDSILPNYNISYLKQTIDQNTTLTGLLFFQKIIIYIFTVIVYEKKTYKSKALGSPVVL